MIFNLVLLWWYYTIIYKQIYCAVSLLYKNNLAFVTLAISNFLISPYWNLISYTYDLIIHSAGFIKMQIFKSQDITGPWEALGEKSRATTPSSVPRLYMFCTTNCRIRTIFKMLVCDSSSLVKEEKKRRKRKQFWQKEKLKL